MPPVGSPPRVRGAGHGGAENVGHAGITPACAGSRSPSPSGASRAPGHPRVCGEQSAISAPQATHWGSPPRVRGAVPLMGALGTMRRITPACAGSSPPKSVTVLSSTDHPRVCGEQREYMSASQLKRGSPPRVRGAAPTYGQEGADHGITPACAGSRHFTHNVTHILPDHPRVCGEQFLP